MLLVGVHSQQAPATLEWNSNALGNPAAHLVAVKDVPLPHSQEVREGYLSLLLT